VDEAEVIERVALLADDEATEVAQVAQPGEEPLDLPAPPVAAQRAAVLGLGLGAVAPVWGNHLDAQLAQSLIQRVGIVGAVANKPLGQLVDKAGVERGGDERHLVRRS